jgi:hypothetical protein
MTGPVGGPVLASRRLLWGLIAATYLLTTAGGLAVVVSVVGDVVPDGVALVANAGGAVVGLSSGAAVVGVLARRRFGYVLEWAACYSLAAGLGVHASLAWWVLVVYGGGPGSALLLTAGVTAALARGTFLALEDWAARRAVLVLRSGGGHA